MSILGHSARRGLICSSRVPAYFTHPGGRPPGFAPCGPIFDFWVRVNRSGSVFLRGTDTARAGIYARRSTVQHENCLLHVRPPHPVGFMMRVAYVISEYDLLAAHLAASSSS